MTGETITVTEEGRREAVPFVESFLRRRGYEPQGEEVQALIGYVIAGLKQGQA